MVLANQASLNSTVNREIQKMKKNLFGGFALGSLLVGGFLAVNSLFIVDQTEQVLVLQFGEHKKTIVEPGLNFKLPFLQQLEVYDKRVLNLDPAVQNFLLNDQEPLDVDYFVRYRISDPLDFYKKVTSITAAQDLLEKQVNSQLREALGQIVLEDILSEKRIEVLQEVTEKSKVGAANLGIEIVDVRIGKADLPEAISQTVFDRMRSERQEEAFEYKAQGKKASLEIRAEADLEVAVLLAKAKSDSDILRGEGEAERIRILNAAHGKDAEFYDFFLSLEANKKSLKKGTGPLYLTTDHPFLKQFSEFAQ